MHNFKNNDHLVVKLELFYFIYQIVLYIIQKNYKSSMPQNVVSFLICVLYLKGRRNFVVSWHFWDVVDWSRYNFRFLGHNMIIWLLNIIRKNPVFLISLNITNHLLSYAMLHNLSFDSSVTNCSCCHEMATQLWLILI